MKKQNFLPLIVLAIQNKMVYGSANSEYNGFCTVNLSTGEITTKVTTVTGFPSFFYSFE